MQLLPIHTPILRKGDDLAGILSASAALQGGDIVVVSSKAVATVEGAAVDCAAITASDEAKSWSTKLGRSPEFVQAVLNETARLHGRPIGSCPGALLTEVTPEGFPHGTILTANAGMDESNVEQHHTVGWPKDPPASAHALRIALQAKVSNVQDPSVGIVISDSNTRPRRLGVTAFALAVSGFEPLASQAGREDLFGRKLRITTEAIADQLATAANFLMGNANQSIPAVIVRDSGVLLTEFEGWVHGIAPDEDLYRGLI